MLDYGTAASTNSASSIEGNLNYNTSSNPTYQTYMALTNTANARVWAGLTNQTAATMAASDNPAGNYAAFRYSTAAGDTTYKCITKDGTTQTIADSGVAPGTGGHKFEILHLASGQTTFKIDGGWACANTTHLPASSTMTRYVNTITTLTNAVRSIRVGWVYVESDK
jgi:hypothetical protein